MPSPYECNFELEEKRAKHMTIEGLEFSIQDALECVTLNINPNKYMDQISVYRMELARRRSKKVKA